jgi:peroxiredoxin
VYRDLKDKGLVVLAITDEEPTLVARFAKQFDIGIPILIDRARAVFDHYNIQAIPKTVILDRQGRSTARPIIISDEAALLRVLAVVGVAP